ncbi:murein L,D-transpeptidase catalytic domain family protein [Hydrotalea sp.]|uniref:murein L,D-transpeptidase catalytic domain family protein n=1 Tax=Hydrotalea sp. TaxID=2881279 RepID=UPI003D106F80
MFTLFSFAPGKAYGPTAPSNKSSVTKSSFSIYQKLDLAAKGLSYQAFEVAYTGMQALYEAGKIQNNQLLTIVDFSLPSTQKRLFVIDVIKGALLFNTYVAHGKNSGKLMATRFSNRPNSYESSLGFYATANTYRGKHGFALRLNGLEPDINDNALNRGIVMHAANYVNEQFIRMQGYLGRSEGCPALPPKVTSAIISTIKEGSCLFIYSSNQQYLAQSTLAQPLPDSLVQNPEVNDANSF